MTKNDPETDEHRPGMGDTPTLRAPGYALLETVIDAIPARVAVLDRNYR